MAKFLAELLGCTLPDKGTPPLFECRSQPHLGLRPSSKQRPTIFGTITNERALFDNRLKQLCHTSRSVTRRTRRHPEETTEEECVSVAVCDDCLHFLQPVKMNPPMINSTSSVSTTKRKREAERSVNWTVEETQVLLCAWSDERIQKSLAENLRNRHVFKHLSARMSEMGFSRSPHQCRLRVKTLKANYVRAKLQRSVDSSQPCTFKYFAEMDAVLGRRSAGEEGGPYIVSSEWMAERHLDSIDRTGSIPSDLNSNTEINGSLGRTGRPCLGSSEERGGHQSWKLDSEVKLEDREDSTDEFEFSSTGFPQRHHEVYLESSIHREMTGTLEENSSPSLHVVPPPPPATPPSPPPPPLTQSAASPLPAHPDPSPTSGHHHPESSCLKHLSECFQRLVSETRGLLVQLESQRQEQARWHQDLLAQWLQREERRQRETAEREERREKTRMEHEIRVLELLTSLAREHGCKCGGRQTVAEAASAP